MDGVETHASGICLSQNSIEISAIIVHLASRLMDDTRSLCYFWFEDPEGAGVGDHHGSSIATYSGPECL